MLSASYCESSWVYVVGLSGKGQMLLKNSSIQSINGVIEGQGIEKEVACWRKEYNQGLRGRQNSKEKKKKKKERERKLKNLQKPENSTMKLFYKLNREVGSQNSKGIRGDPMGNILL